MLKAIVAGALALAIGPSLALAQQGRPAQPIPPAAPGAPAPQSAAPPATPQQAPAAQPQQAPAAPSEAQAQAEGRLAALKARLSLTAEQEKNWPAFEQAYREFAPLRSERWRDLQASRRSDNPLENFQAWAEFASRRVASMKRLADTALPLYQSLEQNQQRRFLDEVYSMHPALARLAGRDEMGRGYGPRWRDGDDDWRGRGPRWGWRGDDYGACPHARPRWGGRDGDWGGGDRPHWHGHGMGPRGGWRDRGDDWRGGGPGMGPRSGWRDRGDDDGPGYWRGRPDWRDGDRYGRRGGPGGRSDEERF